MMRFALIICIWCLALLTICLLNSEHQRPNAGLPVVKSSMADATFVCTPTIPPRLLQHRTREIA